MRLLTLIGGLTCLLASCQFGGSTDPTPAAGLYDPCDFAAECVQDADFCSDVRLQAMGAPVIGAVCTVECRSSAECPEDGACAAFDNTDQTLTTCQRQCLTDGDCADKYFCSTRMTVDLGELGLCVPTCRDPGPPSGC